MWTQKSSGGERSQNNLSLNALGFVLNVCSSALFVISLSTLCSANDEIRHKAAGYVESVILPQVPIDSRIDGYLDDIGRKLKTRVAIIDRCVSGTNGPRTMLTDCSMRESIASGSLTAQLTRISELLPGLKWGFTRDILWVSVADADIDSVMNRGVDGMVFAGTARDYISSLNRYDPRIPRAYFGTSENRYANSEFHVSVELEEANIQEALSVALSQSPDTGLIFRAVYCVPSDALAGGSGADVTNAILYLQFLQPGRLAENIESVE